MIGEGGGMGALGAPTNPWSLGNESPWDLWAQALRVHRGQLEIIEVVVPANQALRVHRGQPSTHALARSVGGSLGRDNTRCGRAAGGAWWNATDLSRSRHPQFLPQFRGR